MAAPDTRWFHMLVSNLTTARRNAMRAKHRGVLPSNELAVTTNAAGTEVLVKVAGADAGFLSSNGLAAVSIRIYTSNDIREFWPIYYSAGWQGS